MSSEFSIIYKDKRLVVDISLHLNDSNNLNFDVYLKILKNIEKYLKIFKNNQI